MKVKPYLIFRWHNLCQYSIIEKGSLVPLTFKNVTCFIPNQCWIRNLRALRQNTLNGPLWITLRLGPLHSYYLLLACSNYLGNPLTLFCPLSSAYIQEEGREKILFGSLWSLFQLEWWGISFFFNFLKST